MNEILNNKTIWEEKNLIEPKKKLESSGTSDLNDIIKNIKKNVIKNEWIDIGNKKKWKKICPNCRRECYYVSEEQLRRSIRNNRNCLKCGSFRKDRYIGMKFGTLTIIKQYNTQSPCGSKIVKVDYRCDCGYIGLNKRFGCVKRQKMCLECKKKNAFKILPNREMTFNLLYSSYIKSAKLRKLEFKLTKEEFKNLTKKECFYCGSNPHTIIKPNAPGGGYIYNGIDRKNNNKGYILENCVSCCKTCNYSKLKLSVDDFLNHVKKIYEHNNLGK